MVSSRHEWPSVFNVHSLKGIVHPKLKNHLSLHAPLQTQNEILCRMYRFTFHFHCIWTCPDIKTLNILVMTFFSTFLTGWARKSRATWLPWRWGSCRARGRSSVPLIVGLLEGADSHQHLFCSVGVWSKMLIKCKCWWWSCDVFPAMCFYWLVIYYISSKLNFICCMCVC